MMPQFSSEILSTSPVFVTKEEELQIPLLSQAKQSQGMSPGRQEPPFKQMMASLV